MDETSPRKWRQLLLFIGGTLVSVGILLYLAEIFFPNTPSSMLPQNDRFLSRFITLPNWETAGFQPLYDASTQTVTLLLNQSYELDGILITYRGLSGKGLFNVEVHVLAFDREMPFRYRISIDKAKEEFHLAGKKLRLLSAKRNRFQFRHLSAPSHE